MEYFLSFQNGEDHFGIHNKYVKEILHIMPLKTVPEMPVFLKGFLNYNRELIPIIDFGLLLNRKNESDKNLYSQIILLKDSYNIGIYVDRVTEFKEMNMEDNFEIRKDAVVNDIFYALFKDNHYDTNMISIENLLLKEEKERIEFLHNEIINRKDRL